MSALIRVINAVAPIRICDIGGWTDTWFAGHGTVLNLAACPLVRVQVFVYPRAAREARITVFAENYDDRFQIKDDASLSGGKHALLEAAFTLMRVPEDIAIEVHLFSEMPAGASTGTSAAASVALIGALDSLTPGRLAAYEVARMAQRIETDLLGLQCGVQDQLCAAHGGVSYIQMSQYPDAAVSVLPLRPELAWELERRLALVYLGSAHVSSDVHKTVIRDFESSGPEDRRLCGLRAEAECAKNGLLEGDLNAFARAMCRNTEWQREMHPDIVGTAAARVIALAAASGAIGWKLNGAGGAGGTMTLLFGPVDCDKRRFAEGLRTELPEARIIPMSLCPHGLRVW